MTSASPASPPADSGLRALVVFADPSLHRSRISRRVADAVSSLPGVEVVDLYQRYPDFYIDVRREREQLKAAPLVLFMFQLGWYAMPALLKEWFDTVFKPEWALDTPGRLHGKTAWVAVACTSQASDYAPGARHGRPLDDFLAPIEQTAKACGMHWLAPHVFYGADASNPDAAAQHAADLRVRLAAHASILADAGGAHGA